MRAARHRERGMTLVELMVVMAIIVILMVVAVVSMRTQPDIHDVSTKVGNEVSEAARKAVAAGAVNPRVVEDFGITARTRVRIFTVSGAQVMALERLQLDEQYPPTNPQWIELSRKLIGQGEIAVVGVRTSAELEPGTSPETAIGPGDTAMIHCYPDGRCDATTLYFSMNRGGTEVKRARLAIIELSGTHMTFSEW